MSPDELAKGQEELPEDNSVELSIVKATRGKDLGPATLAAWDVIESGRAPDSAVRTRPGHPKPVPYISHTWITRTLNAAFKWMWDFEALEVGIDGHDGSAFSRCRLAINIPMPDGSIHQRVITEVGSFEAYPKFKDEKPVMNWDGSPAYTMAASDRIASAVSRGLSKCALRAFNIGLELIDEAGNIAMTPVDAWNQLLRFAKRHGVSRDQVIEMFKSANISGEELVDRFGEAYRLIWNASKSDETNVPDLS